MGIVAQLTEREVEREICAKIAEGEALYHASIVGHRREADEASHIMKAIRDRSLYPDLPIDSVPKSRKALAKSK